MECGGGQRQNGGSITEITGNVIKTVGSMIEGITGITRSMGEDGVTIVTKSVKRFYGQATIG